MAKSMSSVCPVEAYRFTCEMQLVVSSATLHRAGNKSGEADGNQGAVEEQGGNAHMKKQTVTSASSMLRDDCLFFSFDRRRASISRSCSAACQLSGLGESAHPPR